MRKIMFVLGVGVVALSCIWTSIVYFQNRQNNIRADAKIANAHQFLEAVLSRNESDAYRFLSNDAQTAVRNYCLNNQVTHCFDSIVLASWGQFERALVEHSIMQSGTRSSLSFVVVWTNSNSNDARQAIVTVEMISENGQWLVEGWRGFLTGGTYDAEVGALLNHRLHTNEFPPIEPAMFEAQDLRGADLQGVDLQGADLRGAQLSNSNLSGANLRGAILTNADLRHTNLQGADLTDADLTGANLTGAVLNDATLTRSNLTDAFLFASFLSRADLSGARLLNANFGGAMLTDMILPDGIVYSSEINLADYLTSTATPNYLDQTAEESP